MGYRETVLDSAKKDPDHPINHGIKMQVHHLLSQQGVKITGNHDDLKLYGYDINHSGNLIALPCTLEGACRLKVQLHRGNHPKITDTNDDDDEHPSTYHEHIAELIEPLIEELEEKCATGNQKTVQNSLNRLSKIVLHQIKGFKLRLTKVHHFFEENKDGCFGSKNVTELELRSKNKKYTCDRLHSEFKTYVKEQHNLKVGL